MNCRRWCFGVTVVVVAIGIGGIPAVAQQSPPAVEVPAVTVRAVTVPAPRGGPEIATPPISTPTISTPPVRTPPVGTVPSVAVPSVKVGSVTVPAVKTVPASSGGEPPAGGGGTAKPSPSDPPSAGGSSEQPAPHAAPAVAVRGTMTQHSERAAPAATRPAAADAPDRLARSPRSRATSTADHTAPSRVDRHTAPAIGVLDDRAAPTPVPVAHDVKRHDADARPLVDALGPALDVAPLLMALALGGALCVVSRQMRRAG
jgi:hypothetical protein